MYTIETIIDFIENLAPMQYELNDYIKPDWRDTLTDEDFVLATLDEADELLNSLNWKWWKDTNKPRFAVIDRENVKTELVDILHFLLSRTYYKKDWKKHIEEYTYSKPIPFALFDLINYELDVSIEAWVSLLEYFEITLGEINLEYIKKYTLNKFRKDNGYQNGTYQKMLTIEVDKGVEDLLEDNQLMGLVADKIVKTLEKENRTTGTKKFIKLLYKEFEKTYQTKILNN